MIATIGTSSPPKLAIHSISQTLSEISGGADRDRTGGLLVANQALSQLSYSPLKVPSCFELVGLDRLELSTSPLSGVRSSHLSYRPGLAFTNPEPCTSTCSAPSSLAASF